LQQQRLLEIANKCPVHRTLTSSLQIHTSIIDEGRFRQAEEERRKEEEERKGAFVFMGAMMA
jgi:hypothetical protein